MGSELPRSIGWSWGNGSWALSVKQRTPACICSEKVSSAARHWVTCHHVCPVRLLKAIRLSSGRWCLVLFGLFALACWDDLRSQSWKAVFSCHLCCLCFVVDQWYCQLVVVCKLLSFCWSFTPIAEFAMLKHVAATPHVNHMTYSLSQRSAHMLTCSYADMFVKKLRVQKLEADLLTYFPSLFNMASELLSEAELQTAWNQLSVFEAPVGRRMRISVGVLQGSLTVCAVHVEGLQANCSWGGHCNHCLCCLSQFCFWWVICRHQVCWQPCVWLKCRAPAHAPQDWRTRVSGCHDWAQKLKSPERPWSTWRPSLPTRGKEGSSWAFMRLTRSLLTACATCRATCQRLI